MDDDEGSVVELLGTSAASKGELGWIFSPSMCMEKNANVSFQQVG